MKNYKKLFEANEQWSNKKKEVEPDFFEKLALDQNPDFFYIGCCDSRVTAEEIMGVGPGEVFVHRNIANIVDNGDLSILSSIEYAVNFLNVKHIIICGHYNCGGVKSAMIPKDLGVLNPWLRNIRDVYRLHKLELDRSTNEDDKYNRLVELNVLEQCTNVLKCASVQKKYNEGKYPIVHGWVFDIKSGKIIDLNFNHTETLNEIKSIYDLTEHK